MPKLGDYLGSLMSEITLARMRADIESLRVAELYSTHHLLKHMPIPRFRLPDVEIDVPIIIQNIDEDTDDVLRKGAVDLNELNQTYSKVLTSVLNKYGTKLRREAKASLLNEIAVNAQKIKKPADLNFDTIEWANKYVEETINSLSTLGGKPAELSKNKSFISELKSTVGFEFLDKRKSFPRLNVLVNTMELKDKSSSETITTIKLKISEEGMEWTKIEDDTKSEDRLILE